LDLKQVAYGDLTGDGVEEAVLVLVPNDRAVAPFMVLVVQHQPGKLVNLGGTGGIVAASESDRAGQLRGVVVKDSILSVETNGKDVLPGIDSVQYIEKQDYMWKQDRMLAISPPVRRRVLDYQSTPPVPDQPVSFLPASKTTSIQGITNRGDSFVVVPKARGMVSIAFSTDDSTAELAIIGASEETVLKPSNSITKRVELASELRLILRSGGATPAPYDIEVSIDEDQ
jgi:hypothetical protein